ncbi:heavy metal-associated isoprenylated plant protein 30-like [Aristolochia californica]|uniref:heavy metal-associated isoprenylated plant protein 30-like n=1 Tax=Aristolochia californica TaxID=171875 RepID=UPI0035E18D63
MFGCFGQRTMPTYTSPLSIVELKVHMDCIGCEERVRKAISELDGVDSIDINMKQQKVTVTGYVDQKKVLKVVRRAGKKAEYWPSPYDSQYYPYIDEYHDNPTFTSTYNYYRHGCNLEYGDFPDMPYSHIIDDHMIAVFNDENVHACNIM